MMLTFRKTMLGIASAFLCAVVPSTGWSEFDFPVAVPYYVPNIAGAGVGWFPDYIGSDEYRFGVAPGVRMSNGFRSVDLQVNFLTSNVLDHPNWRLGPAAMWRFGRSDVADELVDLLPDIDNTIEVGVAFGYDLPFSDDPRDRLRFSGDVTQDILNEHGGYTASVAVRRWLPVFRFSALMLSAATTYGSQAYTDTYFSITPEGAAASGLPVYTADSGLRDGRLTIAFVQPLSPTFFVSTGLLYSRVLGDAGDSPIVADRGSQDQFVLGVGAAFTF